jgi:hypothetical protein
VTVIHRSGKGVKVLTRVKFAQCIMRPNNTSIRLDIHARVCAAVTSTVSLSLANTDVAKAKKAILQKKPREDEETPR